MSAVRFSHAEMLVLVSLLDGPKHGYAIANDLEAFSGRRPGPGTLYGAISRMEERGLIVQKASRDRRKPYALSRSGDQRAQEELTRLETVAREGRRRLRLRDAR
jgi:DNA-binding PadR family transcriptional regulator